LFVVRSAGLTQRGCHSFTTPNVVFDRVLVPILPGHFNGWIQQQRTHQIHNLTAKDSLILFLLVASSSVGLMQSSQGSACLQEQVPAEPTVLRVSTAFAQHPTNHVMARVEPMFPMCSTESQSMDAQQNAAAHNDVLDDESFPNWPHWLHPGWS
jgi:hypothetical protein